jgi:Fe-S-cluster containining protein
METDLKILEKKSRERWADNWNFRAYLKQNIDPHVLDKTVHQYNAEISKQIDCLQCTNCCHQIHPHLTDSDVNRVAHSLQLSVQDFMKANLEHDEYDEYVFRVKPCPMLQGAHCRVYEARPDDCRSYPHLHKAHFLERSIMVIENYRICPIVFNVYEKLKTAFSYDPKCDYIGDVEQDV